MVGSFPMRRACIPLLCTSILLSACVGGKNVTFDLEFDVDDKAQQANLLMASRRVIDRRLARMGEDIEKEDISTLDGAVSITMTLSSKEGVELLIDELSEPFTLDVMGEVTETDADLVVTGHGGYKRTGLDETFFIGAEAKPDSSPGKGQVLIYLSESGMDKMGEIFKEYNGQFIGLFVRGKLVSKLLVETDEVKDQILIRDIPSLELAEIFADDVNVGLHVTFEREA
jgi:hypothetical protein